MPISNIHPILYVFVVTIFFSSLNWLWLRSVWLVGASLTTDYYPTLIFRIHPENELFHDGPDYFWSWQCISTLLMIYMEKKIWSTIVVKKDGSLMIFILSSLNLHILYTMFSMYLCIVFSAGARKGMLVVVTIIYPICTCVLMGISTVIWRSCKYDRTIQ